MGRPFRDITLYTPTNHRVGTAEYLEENLLQNFVSDLYVQKMSGYKPPKTSRITIQPAFHGIWTRAWKFGSIVNIAPFYSFDEYSSRDKHGKYKYILDLIQVSTIQLSDEYQWDRKVFEKAYRDVIECDFQYKISYPTKMSRDKKKVANLVIEKNETVTTVYVNIEVNNSTIKAKLFDKINTWWYDCTYLLARQSKWHDLNKFGIAYAKGKIDAWYSLDNGEVGLFENKARVEKIDFEKYFPFG